MPTLTVRRGEGPPRSLSFSGEEQSLLQLLNEANLPVRSGCRGIGACGLCRVRAEGVAATAPTAAERIHLSKGLLQQGVRLACQLRPADNLLIDILNPARRSDWRTPPRAGIEHAQRARPSAPGRAVPAEVQRPCGAAVDLGTTNISISVYDLLGSRWISSRVGLNPQRAFGSDVVSRLSAAAESPEAASELSRQAVRAVGAALWEIATREGLDLRRVVHVELVGNTAMVALLSGRNCQLLLQPRHWTEFIPCEPEETTAWSDAWKIHPRATVEVVPPLAGFVGSDLLAGLVATRLLESHAPALLVDFGTNSEIALWNGEKVWVTSAAGGPAFEGGGISCGLPAEPGAIYRVRPGPEGLATEVLDDAEPRGLCGSGLVDLVAMLVRSGALGRNGRFASSVSGGRWILWRQGERELGVGGPDIDALQRAKAAIGAGIRVLSARSGVRLGELQRVCVGGAFGRYLDVENAQTIGLLPAIPAHRLELCGNTALAGCEDVMLSSSAAAHLGESRGKARLINLATEPLFDDLFLESLYLEPIQAT